ncbi:hypothetical protein GCM10017322_04160 [Paracoccus aerius]|nr:hypothetical protein GCM10017322_04160 [Paracoccus aerius]
MGFGRSGSETAARSGRAASVPQAAAPVRTRRRGIMGRAFRKESGLPKPLLDAEETALVVTML